MLSDISEMILHWRKQKVRLIQERKQYRNNLRNYAIKASKILKEQFYAQKVFIVGSLTRNNVHLNSDIDLVVFGLNDELYFKALSKIYEILPNGVELDLIPGEDLSANMQEKSLSYGELID